MQTTSCVIASARLIRSSNGRIGSSTHCLLLQSDRCSRIAIPDGSRGWLLIDPLGSEILTSRNIVILRYAPGLLLEVRRAAGKEDARKLWRG